jgi:hypothetical protein
MLLQAALAAQKSYIETSHLNTFLAPFIREVLPNAKFIHLVRHPYSFAMSATRRNWYAGHQNDNVRVVPAPDSDAGQDWSAYNVFQKNVWLWVETNRWVMDFFATLPASQRLQIRAEDVFHGDLPTIRQLYTFAEVDMPPEHKIQRVIGHRLNVGKANGATDIDGGMPHDLDRLSRETAVRLGYDSMKSILPTTETTW